MSRLFYKTNIQIDLGELKAAVGLVLLKYPLSDGVRQLCFTSHRSKDQSVFDGAGALFDFKNSVWRAHEIDFIYFLDEFKNTYLEKIYHQLQLTFNKKVARIRLMYLPPKTCYSLHFDATVRYHIALETNPAAFLIFKNDLPAHIPSDGFVYFADTREWHSAMNGGDEGRLHLVISLFNEEVMPTPV